MKTTKLPGIQKGLPDPEPSADEVRKVREFPIGEQADGGVLRRQTTKGALEEGALEDDAKKNSALGKTIQRWKAVGQMKESFQGQIENLKLQNEKNVAQMQRQIDDLKSKNEELDAEVASTRRENEKVERQRREAQEAIQKAMDQLAASEREHEASDQQAAAERDASDQQLAEERDALQKNQALQQNQSNDLQNQVLLLVQKLEASRGREKEMEMDRNPLLERLGRLENDAQDFQASVEREQGLEIECNALLERVGTLENDAQHQETQLQSSLGRQQGLEVERSVLNTFLAYSVSAGRRHPRGIGGPGSPQGRGLPLNSSLVSHRGFPVLPLCVPPPRQLQ